ncbi:quinate/shikimate dehydrogenase (pyrroloquinoline-quinone), partial [Serratia odorifera DSM 4582]
MSETHAHTGIKRKLCCYLLGIILAVTGLFFTIAGGKLAALGGSWYFIIAGVVTLLAAIQFFRGKSSAVVLFLLVFVGTLIWSLFDAGLDFWPLVSRLMVPTGLTLLALLSWPSLRKAEGKTPLAKASYLLSAVLAVGMVGTFIQMFQPHPTVPFSGAQLPLIPVDKAKQQKDWDNYGNTPGGSRFVALDQITRDNVKELKVAWTFHTG